MHYKLPVTAFRIGNFAYVTDANYIAPEELEKLRGVEYLVINALRKEKHISHFKFSYERKGLIPEFYAKVMLIGSISPE